MCLLRLLNLTTGDLTHCNFASVSTTSDKSRCFFHLNYFCISQYAYPLIHMTEDVLIRFSYNINYDRCTVNTQQGEYSSFNTVVKQPNHVLLYYSCNKVSVLWGDIAGRFAEMESADKLFV